MGKMKELGLLDCEDRQSIEENFERISKGGSGGDLLETVETEVPLVITWDGNTEGLESFATFYKVSDKILSIDEIIGADIVLANGGEENVLNVTSEKIVDLSAEGVSGFMVAQVMFVAFEDFSVEGQSGSAGIYFAFIPDVNEYTKSLTCPNATTTTTKQQLKPSLLPSHKHKWDDLEDPICGEVEEVIYSAENVEFFIDNEGEVGYSLSEPLPLKEGETYSVIWDGVAYDCVAQSVSGIVGAIFIGNNVMVTGQDTGEPFVYVNLGDNHSFADLESTKAGVTEAPYHNISVLGTISVPLPPKFMPELTQVILISPGGKKFKTTVDDTGQLITTEV